MKSYIIMCFVLLVSMLVSPVASLDFGQFSFSNVKSTITQSQNPEPEAQVPNEEPYDDSVAIMASASGNIINTTELEYIVGCVACEMPASYHEEALKAQAVAAYTNLVRMKNSPDASLNGADISDSPEKHQGYLDEAAQREKWGDKYESYHEKILTAVSAVLGEAIMYDSSPITAAYCAICPGRTESAANIWQSDVPYLQSVTSSGDRLSPDYSSTVILSSEQFRELACADSDISLPDDVSKWITEITPSDSGTGVIKTITIGSKQLSGTAARSLFKLRSPSFTVTCEDGTFTFNVSGYGHCVGMSQYGADYMARQGSNYKEILTHYYQNTQIVQTIV